MLPFKSISIRNGIIALIIALTAIPFGCMVYSLAVERTRQTNEAIQKTSIHAEHVYSHFTQLTGSTELLLNLLSRLPIVQSRDENTVNSMLLDMVDKYPSFSSIFIVDTSGDRWATTNTIAGAVSYSDRRYFKNALTSGRLSSGEYAIGKVKKKPVFSFGLPFRNKAGEICGVVVASIELSYLKNMMAAQMTLEDMSIVVLDYQGKVLLHSTDQKREGQQEHSTVFRRMQQGPQEATLETEAEGGASQNILSYRKLFLPGETSPYMYVRVEAAKAQLLRDSIRKFWINAAVLLAVMIGSIVVAYRISRRFMLDQVDESEQRHRTLFETSLQGIFYQNADGEIISANRVAESVIGDLSAGAMSSAAANEYPSFIHEDGTSYPEKMHPGREALATGKIVPNRIMGIRRSNGYTYTWIRISAIPMLRKNETKPYMAYSMFEDITRQRLQEQQQQAMEQRLLQTQRLESLGVLAGGIAHNFNNVLTIVLGYISYARKFIDPSSKAFMPLENAEKASHRASGIARQLLTFSRGGEPAKKPVWVGKIIKESLTLSLSGTNVMPVIECDEALPATIMADENQLLQSFNCIIINAVQAMPGGGRIVIRCDMEDLQPGNHWGLAEGAYVRLEFSDEGCGISKDDIHKVFTPYFTTKAEIGTGLGLASTHSIITRHGGAIDVTSEVGNGTTFTILLPSAEIPQAETRSDMKADVPARERTGTVLVMDDEANIREFARESLEFAGFRAVTCSDGQTAVSLYKRSLEGMNPFRAVILDLIIPGGMGGKEAAEQILALDPAAKLIVSSGYSDDPVMADYRAFGFSAAVEKPFDVDGLGAALDSILTQ